VPAAAGSWTCGPTSQAAGRTWATDQAMADDESPEITAAMAELAAEDPSAASDAEAAIEWIAGEQGLALITQERIQNFL
jgi:hypothetical protein